MFSQIWGESMKMNISFPGGQRVAATFQDFTIETDQPVDSGGEASAPDPFSLFLSSIGTCTGIYVLRFCQERKLPTDELFLTLDANWDDEIGLVDTITITIQTGSSFPEKYKPALIKVAKLCTVKRQLEQPPDISVIVNQ
jgi:ribosomal protein S12 methylthiotransferase accessory factor